MQTRILITGAAGFIGSHVVEHLLKNTDWRIVGLDRLNTSGNYNRLVDMDCWASEGYRFSSVVHDFRCAINDQVAAQIGEVDYILHMGASTHVDRSISDPMSFALDNVIGTVNMLEFARKLPRLKKFAFFSTDEVFGPAMSGINYAEGSRHNPGNPYAAAKAAAEDFCSAYANTYKMPIFITNTMNVLGERQHPEKFLPLVIKKVLAGEEVKIHANKEKTVPGSRFYIHARNVADAVLFLLETNQEYLDTHDRTKGSFNIVGEKEMNNLELAQLIASAIRGKELKYELVDFHSSRPGHDLRYALDGSKMAKLGWNPPVGIEESVKRIVEWTLEHKEWLR